ncbi:MAG: energy transducer TonB [Vicinamibacteria bacterium]
MMITCGALVVAVSLGIPPQPSADTQPSPALKIAALARLALVARSESGISLINDALSDESAPVRAAGARMAHSLGAQATVPALRGSLDKETDLSAALEISWALADLDKTDDSDATFRRALTKENTRLAVLKGLTAGWGPRMMKLWPELRPVIETSPSVTIQGLRLGLQTDGVALLASFALREHLDRVFESTVLGARVSPSLAISGLSSMASSVRTASYLVLARTESQGEASAIPELRAAEGIDERLARHLFEAAWNRPRTEPFLPLIAEHRSTLRELKQERYMKARLSFRGLSSGEQKQLLLASDFEERESGASPTDPPDLFSPDSADSGAPPITKSLWGHPPQFVRSVLDSTGCQGQANRFDGVEVSYLPGGRIRKVAGLQTSRTAPGCQEASRILGATSLASGGHSRVVAILPERPSFLACLADTFDEPPSGVEAPGELSPSIKEPKKITNVNPVYPEAGKDARVGGKVILEAFITRTGCVAHLRVSRSVHPVFDLSAIDAVSGWIYSPTLLNGKPHPALMTITVNYRLN